MSFELPDERQAAELAYEALVRAAEALRAQLGPPEAERDDEPPGGSSEESVADSDASDSHEEDSSSDSDSDSGDDYDSAESDDSADGRLVADYTGAVDDSRFCDRCRAWGHTNNYCGSLPANKRRRVE